MSSPFLGEVRPWALNFAPRGWAFCAGQILSISQNTALFSLLGTFYGGNGTSNFALPDLRGRVPLKYGTAPTGDVYDLGQVAGEEQVTLLSTEMPLHTHSFSGTSSAGFVSKPPQDGAYATSSGGHAYYASDANNLTALHPAVVSVVGGNAAHTNLQPYLAINWCIALQGIFPSRN